MQIHTGLYSETGPPTDIADRINASFPYLLNAGMAHRAMKEITKVDKYAAVFLYLLRKYKCLCREILEGLHSRGFRTNQGLYEGGLLLMVMQKAGGYYLGAFGRL